MDIFIQIAQGSVLLIFCTLLQIAMQVWAAKKVRQREEALSKAGSIFAFSLSSAVVLVLLLSHTIHLYLWAIALRVMGAVQLNEEAIYFALATYTTAGYGDIVLEPEHRVFGAMAAVNGVLAFGLTTAFLVALFRQMAGLLSDD